MSVIKFLRDISDLFNWSTDENPTSQQDYQNAVKNWVATETSIVDALLWQPETVYAVGNQVKTPSLPSESVLVCTVAGTSGASEPDYTNVSVGDTITDGTVEWEVGVVFTSATVGTILEVSTSADVSLSASTAKNITSLTVPKGTWIITGHARFDGVTNGHAYGVVFGATSNSYNSNSDSAIYVHSSSTTPISIQTTRIIVQNYQATVYFVGYANAACKVLSGATFRAIRIS